MSHRVPAVLLSLAVIGLAPSSCDDSADAPSGATEARAAEAELAEYIEPDDLPAPPPPKSAEVPHKLRQRESMPEAERTFAEVMDLVQANYVDGPLDTDEIWTAATEGMLSRLIQVKGAHVNTLMSPRDLENLLVSTQGQLVGVGVMIEMIADVLVVRQVIPGGPAAAAGLQGGDRILGIDGERIKGKPLDEIVGRIRGTEGSTVSLFVQRDTEEWDAELTRSRIEYSSVDGTMLSDTVGYLRITEFSKSTAADVSAKLTELEKAGMKSLVLDVRDCPGGVLEASVEVTDLFMLPGQTVMSKSGRASENETVRTDSEDPWDALPIVALVGPYTASGAEILTAALQHHGRARLVGTQTMGKGTVEEVHQLSNGWGLKLSSSRFRTASGEFVLGRGVSPDIEIPADEKSIRKPADELDPETDRQLAAALTLAKD